MGKIMVFYHTIHVLGVLEWFYSSLEKKIIFPKSSMCFVFHYMLTEKILFHKKSSMGFSSTPSDPPGYGKRPNFHHFFGTLPLAHLIHKFATYLLLGICMNISISHFFALYLLLRIWMFPLAIYAQSRTTAALITFGKNIILNGNEIHKNWKMLRALCKI